MYLKYCCYFLLCSTIFVASQEENATTQLPEVQGDKFYYFGYGSNMLEKRIHMQNPTSVKIGPGMLKVRKATNKCLKSQIYILLPCLQNYRLDFNGYTERWRGAPATIVPTENVTVYGTLWDISMENLDDIDKYAQKAVQNVYLKYVILQSGRCSSWHLQAGQRGSYEAKRQQHNGTCLCSG